MANRLPVSQKLNHPQEKISDIRKYFHGTNENYAKEICDHGVVYDRMIKLSRSFTDFGVGFYVTENQKQAESYAQYRHSSRPAVVEIELDGKMMAGLHHRAFGSDSDAYWALVQFHRLFLPRDAVGVAHSWDVVTGPVAIKIVQSRSRCRVENSYDQTSFHTRQALDILNRGTRRWYRVR